LNKKGSFMGHKVHKSVQAKLLMVVISILAVSLSACARTTAQQQDQNPTPYPTPVIPLKPNYTVQKGEVTRVLNFVGRVDPVAREDLFFKTGGRVNKVYVNANDVVKKGQLLAELDTGSSSFDIQRAQINLDNAQLNLQLAKIQNPSPSMEYPIIIALKENEVKLAQLALDQLNASVADATIVAPIDGTLISMTLTEGTTVDAFSPIMVIANMDNLEVTAELTTDQMSQVAEGMPVTATPVGRPGDTLTGSITSLPYPYGTGGSATDQTNNVATITISTNLIKDGYSLGDLLQVTAVLEKKDNALWLPPAAIRTFQGRQFVVVQTGDGQTQVDVKLGIQSVDRVEILDGLTEGQVVMAP
jgi:multidrug efflux pump subunit AcrA (membrane-fusion protein)